MASCWALFIAVFMLGGFLGIMLMAICVAARDADDRAARWRTLDVDEDDEGSGNGSNGSGKNDARRNH
jgi:hypothetical protein